MSAFTREASEPVPEAGPTHELDVVGEGWSTAPGTRSLTETHYDVRSRTLRTVAAYHCFPPCAVGPRACVRARARRRSRVQPVARRARVATALAAATRGGL